MRSTARLLLAIILAWSCVVPADLLLADRPGSYDNTIVGRPGVHQAGGQAGTHHHGGRGSGLVYSWQNGLSHVSPWGYGCLPGSTYPAWNAYHGVFGVPGYGYGITYDPATQAVQYQLPPVVVPGELLYGPQAVQRFFGVATGPAVAPAASVLPRVPLADDLDLDAAGIAERLRKSNDVSRDRAEVRRLR